MVVAQTFKVALAQFGPSMADRYGANTIEIVDLPQTLCTKDQLAEVDGGRVKDRISITSSELPSGPMFWAM